jgi:ribose/xylose/arabinose/galactoside ABC-type transport system permease subunit
MMRKKAISRIIWPLVALAIILLFNLLFTPRFFHIEIKDGHLFGSLVDILKRAAPVMIISIGMTLVIATKGIDISVGSTIAIAGAIAVILINTYTPPLVLVIPAALAAAILCGIFNGFLVAFVDIQPIVATLILMVMGRGIAQLITGGNVLYFKYKPFEFLGIGYILGIPFPIILAILIFVITDLITKRYPI